MTQWRQLVSCDWSWHSQGSLIPGKIDPKINLWKCRYRNVVELRAPTHRLQTLLPLSKTTSFTSGPCLEILRDVYTPWKQFHYVRAFDTPFSQLQQNMSFASIFCLSFLKPFLVLNTRSLVLRIRNWPIYCLLLDPLFSLSVCNFRSIHKSFRIKRAWVNAFTSIYFNFFEAVKFSFVKSGHR